MQESLYVFSTDKSAAAAALLNGLPEQIGH
jgi:hypothetical protein